jgi:hypothetical protein
MTVENNNSYLHYQMRNFFWQESSSRPEAAAEGRETSEVKEET